ncbi:alkaline ceramidase-like protein [Amniculicola lignicola CBS 123094]|uniref:Alkaline ceramidase-like protein n=1 Tax=Amniculicola lignicola CBS 123094 TaxID=1392246 RepID=A0A6A5VYL5_9PLEO|nr:alkaline ceramidase-like protein [Amniculicola lignicola CBS 123094]
MISLSWPYGHPPGFGAWGVPTSNHNFCEQDYVITEYIAEFVNTLTNLTYVVYGIHGLRRVAPRGDGGLLSTLAFPYWALVSVGVLSGWFHSVLNYRSQMGDDLSMLLAVGAILQQVYTFNAKSRERLISTFIILASNIAIAVYHCWTDEIVMHEIAFAVQVFIVGRKTRQLIRARVKSDHAKKKLQWLASMGLGSGLFGYFLWNIDFHLCSYVTSVKRSVGLPWGLFLELHGWWHIFTGIGAYTGMALAEYLVTFEEGKEDRFEEGFVWPVHAILSNLEGKKNPEKEQ